ncbi:MAG: PHP domain-containing protein, partial [Bacteroidales bacterium]|nr:PHP domain-containing protein [Bacteroidales bacterium]
MDYLQSLPAPEALLHKHSHDRQVPEVNGHLHSPNSFCAFNSIEQMFQMAVEEGVKVLGINDFYTVDGYDEFAMEGLRNRIFPLFNIEFMGLIQDMQKQDIRVNDPNNPGRIYFSGKALKHPLSVSNENRKFLEDLQQSSQIQVREMISKADAHLLSINARFNITYE